MTPCHECQRARETAGRCAWYCPTCLHCGARLIQRIGALQIPQSVKRTRQTRVLNDWMAYGHLESELRRLAKGELPLQPMHASSQSESQSQAKSRSPLQKSLSP